MAFSKHGKYWYAEDSWQDYKKVPWGTISDSSRRKIMKHLIPKPEACPGCGTSACDKGEDYFVNAPGGRRIKMPGVSTEQVLILCNRSGNLLYDLNDWYWSCRKCEGRAYKEAHRNPPYIHLTK